MDGSREVCGVVWQHLVALFSWPFMAKSNVFLQQVDVVFDPVAGHPKLFREFGERERGMESQCLQNLFGCRNARFLGSGIGFLGGFLGSHSTFLGSRFRFSGSAPRAQEHDGHRAAATTTRGSGTPAFAQRAKMPVSPVRKGIISGSSVVIAGLPVPDGFHGGAKRRPKSARANGHSPRHPKPFARMPGGRRHGILRKRF